MPRQRSGLVKGNSKSIVTSKGRHRVKATQAITDTPKRPERTFSILKKNTIKTKSVNFQELFVTRWLEKSLGITKPDHVEFGDWVADGLYLCQVTNVIHPGAISHYHKDPTGRFQMIQNVNIFICAANALKLFELADARAFQPLDLVEKSNMPAVLSCLYSIGLKFPDIQSKEILETEVKKIEEPHPLRASFSRVLTNDISEWKAGRKRDSIIRSKSNLPKGISHWRFASSSNLAPGLKLNRRSVIERKKSKRITAENLDSIRPYIEPTFTKSEIKKEEKEIQSSTKESENKEIDVVPDIVVSSIYKPDDEFSEEEDDWDTITDTDERSSVIIQKESSSKSIDTPKVENIPITEVESYGDYAYDDYANDENSQNSCNSGKEEGVMVFGVNRGPCTGKLDDISCPCKQYEHSEKLEEGGPCLNCGHYPVHHKDLSSFGNFYLDSKHWEIDYNQLEFSVQIGNGAFGKVWQGKLWGGDVAIKAINPDLVGEFDEDVIADFTQEVSVLSTIRHPNCVLFIAATLTPPLCIVTLGSLQNVLTQVKTRDMLTWERRLGLAVDACLGMTYLHQLGIIHRDLKSGNLLVDMNWRLAVGDFGLSIMDSKETGSVGTIGYIAPELIRGFEATPAVDVFSYGIVLWEIFTGEIIGDHISEDVLVVEASVLSGERPIIPLVVPDPMKELIERCWHDEPEQRPIFEEICVELKKMYGYHGVVDIIYGTKSKNIGSNTTRSMSF